MRLIKDKNVHKILIISILIFLSKWILSFYYFNEDLSVKILYEGVGDGTSWYPYVKYITEFSFNNSFDPNVELSNHVPLPVSSFYAHALLYKIFSSAGFILVEFFAIFLFLIIFFKIFSIYFTNNESIIISLIFLIFPSLINLLNIDISYLNVIETNFFSLRAHRPNPANLFFFFFIYLIVNIDQDIDLIKKKINLSRCNFRA